MRTRERYDTDDQEEYHDDAQQEHIPRRMTHSKDIEFLFGSFSLQPRKATIQPARTTKTYIVEWSQVFMEDIGPFRENILNSLQ